MGAIGLYQCIYHAIALYRALGMACAGLLTGWNIWIQTANGVAPAPPACGSVLSDMHMVASVIMLQAFILNKYASMMLGWSPTIWVDMFSRRKCCPYLTRFPYNTLAHPMFWTGQVSYVLYSFTMGGSGWFGILYSFVDIVGNQYFLRCVEEPYIQWFFIDETPMPPDHFDDDLWGLNKASSSKAAGFDVPTESWGA